MTFDIATVGHFSIDLIILPKGTIQEPALGGAPTYSSLAAIELGAIVTVVSKVGEDFPLKYVKWLKTQGVDLSGLKRVMGSQTTNYLINQSEDGNRHLKLNRRSPPIEIDDIPRSFETRAVHIAPIVNEVVVEVFQRFRNLSELVSIDAQGFLRYFNSDGTVYLGEMLYPEVLRDADILKASQDEIEAMTGESLIQRAIEKIHRKRVRTVLVTKGADGAVLSIDNKKYQIPAQKPNQILDKTGAGDSFMGGYLAEIIKGEDPIWCACVGSATASCVIEQIGPLKLGSKKKVYERAEQIYTKTHLIG